MKSNYVDTTVLTEALLKTRGRRQAAIGRIGSAPSQLSVYAIKEFKAGPLQNYVWLHNKLNTTKSLIATYQAIASNIRQPYRVTTSLEALQLAAESASVKTITGSKTRRELDETNASMYALSIRRRISRAWSDRRKICNSMGPEVDCYSERGPFYDEATDLIENPENRCKTGNMCGYSYEYRKDLSKVTALIQAIEGESRAEDNRRRRALHVLANTPKRSFEDQDCRALGDAHFTLTCPPEACILTSNTKDHQKLANALGVCVSVFP